MVTIATNMAGRGTDIVLGGNVEKQVELIEADDADSPPDKSDAASRSCEPSGSSCTRRCWPPAGCTSSAPSATSRGAIDNQLRGRSGRQGDPGSSRFYLSLEDPLMRIFAGDRVKRDHGSCSRCPKARRSSTPCVSRSIESAQRKVEARNFDIRKQLLEYDDVANDQRKVIYQQRNECSRPRTSRRRDRAAARRVRDRRGRAAIVPAESVEEQWDMAGLEKALRERVAARAAAGSRWWKTARPSPTTTSSSKVVARRPSGCTRAR